MQQEYTARAERIMQRIQQLAAISDDPDGVTRTFGTPAFVAGRDLVQSWLEAAGLPTRTDGIGNLRARLESPNPDAKTFVLASHIDTVVNAGKFDGPLGVLMGLDLLENLLAQQVALPFHIELIAFSDEEGVRFHTTYLGSKVVTGAFDPALLGRCDAAGISLDQALVAMGGDASTLALDAIPAAEWLGYFELHIEQGPVLWERNVPVALVTAIAGQQRVELTFRGMAGHAGTVPMNMRQDALCAAAEFVLTAEQFAQVHGRGLVATVGKLAISHSASNVIPGEVTCSLDLRSPDEAQLAQAYDYLRSHAEAVAGHRNVALDWNLVQKTAPVTCDAGLNALLAQAIAASGYETIALVSGAGHDAVPVSFVAPATMMFIRCYKGISHNPLENVELADLAAAVAVADQFITLLRTQNPTR
ncbi:allantoate amidohydrolase [Hymenobacter properus]|uniref:Allantoate amidohydrolase n=1 Tax=Hymenobacter properus TaxID=2791026 RepID=A0A931BJL6_9BACT|nr:allantoate amidohydrolase [Hymenobacter properus]MBF9143483.1 allantoate amidohydrolase [Hymenobacter properus]MBR7722296.1 allantoate amidohydrolase [Microvirga sp. SRT04]